MHLSFSFSSAMPKFPGIEVPGNSDFQCAYLPSSTRSLTGEPSVFNSHWHLPHDWYWLAPIRRELPSVNIYKSTHLTHSPWLLLSAISLSLTINSTPPVHTRAPAWCSSPVVLIISTSSCCSLGRDKKLKLIQWRKHRCHIFKRHCPLISCWNALASVLKMLFFPICFAR